MHRHELDEHVDAVVRGILPALPPQLTQFAVTTDGLRADIRPHVEKVAGAAPDPAKIDWTPTVDLVVAALSSVQRSWERSGAGPPPAPAE